MKGFSERDGGGEFCPYFCYYLFQSFLPTEKSTQREILEPPGVVSFLKRLGGVINDTIPNFLYYFIEF